MRNYSLKEAQSNLGQLIAEAQQGETIIISDEQDHVVQLVPIKKTKKAHQAGSARGLIHMTDDFDEYMSSKLCMSVAY